MLAALKQFRSQVSYGLTQLTQTFELVVTFIHCSRITAESTRANMFPLSELIACGTVYQLNRCILVA